MLILYAPQIGSVRRQSLLELAQQHFRHRCRTPTTAKLVHKAPLSKHNLVAARDVPARHFNEGFAGSHEEQPAADS